MIFVDIRGGLGNQLFQYATARSLAIDKGSDFLMNLSDYESEDSKKVDHVEFKLNHFNIDFKKQIEEDEIKNYPNVKTIVEPLSSDNFSPYFDFTKYSGNIYLRGYWQDERYFKHNEQIIKEDLQVATPPNKKNQKMLDEISESNGICISFRRGEYLDSYFIAQFGICTEDYYKKAINFITRKVENPTFFIFSDDVDWIEDNVKLNYPTIPITFNGVGDEHEELRLMANCNHFILANSSFSWWGAWLSKNKNKLVFAPKPWFNSYTKESILCANWIQLNCDRSDLFNKFDSQIYNLLTKRDVKYINYENINLDIGNYGISLKSEGNSKIDLNTNYFNQIEGNEFLIEFKLFSNKKGIIKVDYGWDRKITLGYRKGHSNKYLHLVNIRLCDVLLEISDDSLVIEDITIKSIVSDFKLIIE